MLTGTIGAVNRQMGGVVELVELKREEDDDDDHNERYED